MNKNNPLYKEANPKGYGYKTSLFIYECMAIFILAPLVGLTYVLLNNFVSEAVAEKVIDQLGPAALVIYFIINGLVFNKAARIRATHHYTYIDALVQVFVEMKITLSYAPIIGPFFSNKIDRKNE